MSPYEGWTRSGWLKKNGRLLATMAVAVLLVGTLIGTILTAPISELVIVVCNWEGETLGISMRVDDSRASHSYDIDVGGSIDEILHVSPGTHSVSFDFTYEHPYDGVIDFVWTTHVGFNQLEFLLLEVDADGIEENPVENPGADKTPMEQALSDPFVMIPSALFVTLVAVLVILAWDCGRRSRER